jgi:ABC-type Fe3+-hydroxamate transport system substrate-binding protein
VHETDDFSPKQGHSLNKTTVLQAQPRIVSLVPSLTELLFSMGLGAYVVGRTGFCIHPAAQVQAVPKVGGTKDVNLEKIRRLAPSHVLVNVDENQLGTVQALRTFVPHVVVTHPITPFDNLALIDQIADVLFCHLNTDELIANNDHLTLTLALKIKINENLAALKSRPQRKTQNVLYLIWKDPWMTVARDTYISHMLSLVGWQTWPSSEGGDGISMPGAGRYPVVIGNESWLASIDRVLLSSEPYSFNAAHVDSVRQWLPHAKVQLVDGEMLSWYGSRAVSGLEYLAQLDDFEPTEA